MSEIAALTLISGGALGVVLGWVLGWRSGKKALPTVRELENAMEVQRKIYKQQLGYANRRAGEYEQPAELMRLANQSADEGDLVTMFVNQLGGIKALPGWLRPFLPAISDYVQKNPEQVKALLTKFAGQLGSEKQISNADEAML